MLVRSANEAAMALAEYTSGSVEQFVVAMNAKAAELGLKDTHFANPHGLDVPGHYSSARDLATLARYAMGIPLFRKWVGMKAVTLTGKAGKRTYESTDVLLRTFPGAEGIKTGWTNGAGYSVVSAARRGKVELVAVIMGTNSENARFRQASRLLEWGFAHYAYRGIATAGTPAGTVPVSDYLDRTVPVAVSENASAPVLDVEGPVTRSFSMAKQVQAPVTVGERLGTMSVLQAGRLLAQVPVVATRATSAPGEWESFTIWLARTWRSVAGGPKIATATPAPASP
jgi:D-alanyl-D-alanine carboxypeptidase (penicillin-binding protein 5/6)